MAPYQLLLQLMPGHQHTPDWQQFNFLWRIYVGQIWDVYIYICMMCICLYIYVDFILYIYCCRVFLMSWINHYQALTGVHLSLIWPVWARFNNWLPDGRIFVGLQQRLDRKTPGGVLVNHLSSWRMGSAWWHIPVSLWGVFVVVVGATWFNELSVGVTVTGGILVGLHTEWCVVRVIGT